MGFPLKKADTSSGKATHRGSTIRGIQLLGTSDGKVYTLQTLHNLDEDELSGFEQAWNGAAQRHMPRLNNQFSTYGTLGAGSSRDGQSGQRGWALPSNELPQNTRNIVAEGQGEPVSPQLYLSGNHSSRGRANH